MRHHRLGAVVTRADGNAHLVNQRADIKRMQTVDVEGDDGGLVRRGAVNAEAFHRAELFRAVLQQLLFPCRNRVTTQPLDVLDGGLQPDNVADGRGTRLKLERQFVVGRLLERHVLDHLAAALIRGHLVEPLLLAVKDADAHRGVHLVAGKTVEVTVKLLDVHGNVGHGLRTVHQHGDVAGVCRTDDRLHGVDRAERVGDVADGHDAGAVGEEGIELFHREGAVVVEGEDAEGGALPLACHLPRHEVGVVFHLGDEHFVTGFQEALAEGGSDEVHRLGGAAGEDHLLGGGCVDEALDGAAGHLELLGGKLAQMVHATVDVAVDGEVVAGERFDDRHRLLRGGGIVEIDERAAVDRLLQYREILAVIHNLRCFSGVQKYDFSTKGKALLFAPLFPFFFRQLREQNL